MASSINLFQRKTTRMQGYDYTQPGAYFVTLLTYRRQCLFGALINGVMQLTPLGELASTCWQALESRFQLVQLDEFVVMPDHIHGILMLTEDDSTGRIRARQQETAGSLRTEITSPLPITPSKGSLGSIIAAYKSTVARLYNGMMKSPRTKIWNRNYHDRIIRNEAELYRIQVYIRENPTNWLANKDEQWW